MRLFGRLAVLGGMTLAMTACGKKGVLVYPDMLVPAAPSAASAFQSGSGVKIQFEVPTTDRTGNRLNDLAGLNISKRESDSASEQTCPACLDDYHLFRKLYLDLLKRCLTNMKAVLDYRTAHGITEDIIPIDWAGVFWRKESRASA